MVGNSYTLNQSETGISWGGKTREPIIWWPFEIQSM